jgi:hypothetical protein
MATPKSGRKGGVAGKLVADVSGLAYVAAAVCRCGQSTRCKRARFGPKATTNLSHHLLTFLRMRQEHPPTRLLQIDKLHLVRSRLSCQLRWERYVHTETIST